MRIKEYSEDFLSLPNPLKITIYLIIGVIVLICLHQGISNYAGSKKIERLEKQNAELEKVVIAADQKAVAAENRASNAERNAANEILRSKILEKTLKNLDKKTDKQDEKILKQQKKSNSIRDDLRRVRSSKPKRADENEIRRKSANRYGQSNDSQ